MKKKQRLLLIYLVLTAVFIGYSVFQQIPIKLERGIYIKKPIPIAHFELTDNKGNLFTETQLKGHWSLIFFGFSSCPMICPLTMEVLAKTHEKLLKTNKPEVIFISVDPENDTLERLNQFIHQFNSNFIALRGDLMAVNDLQKKLHVKISRTPQNHGTEILLINPEAKIQAYFYYPIPVKSLVSDLNLLIT